MSTCSHNSIFWHMGTIHLIGLHTPPLISLWNLIAARQTFQNHSVMLCNNGIVWHMGTIHLMELHTFSTQFRSRTLLLQCKHFKTIQSCCAHIINVLRILIITDSVIHLMEKVLKYDSYEYQTNSVQERNDDKYKRKKNSSLMPELTHALNLMHTK